MIYLYKKTGELAICEPEQVKKMKSIGYTETENPIVEVIPEVSEITETIEVPEVTVDKKNKKIKDIILD